MSYFLQIIVDTNNNKYKAIDLLVQVIWMALDSQSVDLILPKLDTVWVQFTITIQARRNSNTIYTWAIKQFKRLFCKYLKCNEQDHIWAWDKLENCSISSNVYLSSWFRFLYLKKSSMPVYLAESCLNPRKRQCTMTLYMTWLIQFSDFYLGSYVAYYWLYNCQLGSFSFE